MNKKIQFIDVTLRDGHQSLAATRMTTAQALRVLPLIEQAGFTSLELWGGAVLDSCLRFLNEDPWERLEAFRDLLGGPQRIRALLRGQNLFGYRPYPDDLVIAFIKQAVASGVGVMRIFDAMNDFRNIQVPLLATRAYGATAEAAISYTTSPVHTTQYFIEYARLLEEEGADRIAIKDMAGLLHPHVAYELFNGLRHSIRVPIVLHCHATTGVALLNSVIAMQTGIDAIDTCITPFAGGSSHPSVEVLMVFAEEMGLEHGLNEDFVLAAQAELFKIYTELSDKIPSYGKFFRPFRCADVDRDIVRQVIGLVAQASPAAIEQALALTRQLENDLKFPHYDDRMFESQIPGGMLSNLQSQLMEMGHPDLFPDLMKVIAEVRKDAGYVPLVTPTSQIVGSQAALNLIFGPYNMLTNEFRMMLRGEFGRAPGPINPEVLRKVLATGEEVVKYRPASYLKPAMEDRCKLAYVKTHKDLLLHLMLDQAADTFLHNRHQALLEEEEYFATI
jgi:pyruvate/oxaloacetate carboxyltransferase